MKRILVFLALSVSLLLMYSCSCSGDSPQGQMKLDTPVITNIEYDNVYWSPVDNATSYTVIVNEEYTYTTSSLSATLADVRYNGASITRADTVSVTIQANGGGKYLTSDKSLAYSYYYVPEKQSLTSEEANLKNYGIGYGYNLLENEPVDLKKISNYSVINIAKLLTLGEHYSPTITEGFLDSYNYSSVDELMSHINTSLDASVGLGFGPKNAIGEIKAQYELETEVDKSQYLYNEIYVVQEDFIFDTHSFKEYSIEQLKYCMTETFLEDLKKSNTMSEDAWLKHMYDTYGTHVILGVARGASYTAEYIVSTNNESVAVNVKNKFSLNGSVPLSNFLKIDLGLGFSMEEGYDWKGNETEAHFKIFWKGSTSGGTPTLDNLDSAISNFEQGIGASTAAIIGFTTDGAISIGTLISLVDASLGEKFENYVNNKADEEYLELYSQYTKYSTLPVSIENIYGENVLTIDLSSYQNIGSLDDAYNANLLDGVFTVYPMMMGKVIDKIVVVGAFDNCKNYIDGFSIKLTKSWQKDIVIEVKNLGVICASPKGFVDKSLVSSKYDVVVKIDDITKIVARESKNLEYTLNSDNKSYSVTGIGSCTDTYIIIPNTYNGLPITGIDSYVFANRNSLISIYIPDSVTNIGANAFYGCSSLTSVELAENSQLISIGENAFFNCIELKSVHLNSTDSDDMISANISFDGRYANPMCYGAKLYLNGTLVTDVNITEKYITVGNILTGCTSIVNVTIADSVKSISDYAFYGCSELTSIVIPESVTSIGDYAFYGCKSLTNIVIPASVTSIGSNAFYGCSALISVELAEDSQLISIGEKAFYGCNNIENVYLSGKDSNNMVLASISFNDCYANPMYYGAKLYLNGTLITDIYIGDEFTTVGNILTGCTSIVNVTISNGVTSIEDYAFQGCYGLKSIVISDSVTSIGEGAFSNCTRLTSIKYCGSEEQWNVISKGTSWDSFTGDYTITYNYTGE